MMELRVALKAFGCLLLCLLVACSQPSSPVRPDPVDNRFIGIGDISVGDTVVTPQAPDQFIVANQLRFTLGDGGLIYDRTHQRMFLRRRVQVQNVSADTLSNLTLMGFVRDPQILSATHTFQDLVGNAISQEVAFNARADLTRRTDPQTGRIIYSADTVNPKFMPRPVHAQQQTGAEVSVSSAHANFVAYKPSELATVANDIANHPAITFDNYKLLPYGFQVGSLAPGERETVDISFMMPASASSANRDQESLLSRFNFTFAAVTDPNGRITQDITEIQDSPDVGIIAAQDRYLTPTQLPASKLSNLQSLAVIGDRQRNVSEAVQAHLVCIADVQIGFQETDFQTPVNLLDGQDGLAPGECTPTDSNDVVISTLAATHGFIYPPSVTVNQGNDVRVDVVPDRGYEIASVTGCEGDLQGFGFEIANAQRSCTLTATFRQQTLDNVTALFTPHRVTRDDYTLTYHLYTPELRENTSYPLILALHGTTEGIAATAGRLENPHIQYDPENHFDITRPVATAWLQSHVREAYPAYVLAPLVPYPDRDQPDQPWANDFLMLIYNDLIQDLIDNGQVDPTRIYITGHSIGAAQSWNAPAIVTDRFAALIPTAGNWGTPDNGTTLEQTIANEYPHLSIWNFGHVRDRDGSVLGTRALRAAMQTTGLNSKLTDDLDERAARIDTLRHINQGGQYLFTEYRLPCVGDGSGCHYLATDTAGTDPL
ncbi:MAG: hypothetical protein AAF267_16480, partial [Deinococcota bacterium]